MANTTKDVDSRELLPLLHKMDGEKDVQVLLEMARNFLKACRFAEDKVRVLEREITTKTSARAIQMFCWNTLLSGQGLAVTKW